MDVLLLLLIFAHLYILYLLLLKILREELLIPLCTDIVNLL